MGTLRRWWPIPVLVALGLVAEQIFRAQYPTATGHAEGHLGSAAAVFMGVPVLAIVFWATPGAIRKPEVAAAGALWIGGLMLGLVANVRIVDAIGGRDWTDDQAAEFGGSIPAFVSGHDLAGTAGWVAVGAMVAFAIAMYLRRYVSLGVAIGSVALTIVFPPWIAPGFGVVVLVVATCLARRRRLSARTPG